MEGNGIKLADDIINLGIELGASDIHLEPLEENLRIRMRVDGLLRVVDYVESSKAALISRIKIMSGMDIAEKRIPQDGRYEFTYENRKIDLRIACLPTIFGEKIVIRILDKGKSLLNLDALSFSETNRERYKKLYKSPHGIVLLTGPTGSGKSTTLYATLLEINSLEKNIITIEDPVEYQLDGINQVSVNVKTGLDFANSLRSILRQDPDVIMVGEIRDGITADIAIESGLTGHTVLSTLHCNTAVGTITRLLDMGVEKYRVASALRGSVAQRLVRRLCPKCKTKRQANTFELSYLGLKENFEVYEPKGCEVCNNIGFKGRLALQEIFIMDDVFVEALVKNASEKELQSLAVQKGMKTLHEDGREKVLQGLTTVDELLRVGV